jgi:hypothetical protein
VFTKLRTGHAWLAAHAKNLRFAEEDKCRCGARESVVYVLENCSDLRDLR